MAKLYFYYSAMNAGKSTTLLQSAYNYQERGMNPLLLTPVIDTRTPPKTISSRIGLNAKATAVQRDTDIYTMVIEHLTTVQPIHCILVDEAQFLSKAQVQQLSKLTVDHKIPVLTYGLRSDFQGEPFEGSKYLLTMADELVEIKTICHCGKKATMNMRIDASGKPIREGEQIHIGGNESYIATCRTHFYSGETGMV